MFLSEKLIKIKDPSQLKKGAILVDKDGNRRKIVYKTKSGNYWLTHKNSDITGVCWKFDYLKTHDKLLIKIEKT